MVYVDYGHSQWLIRSVSRSFEAMARKVNVDDLVGAAEIAERLGLARRETVHNWRRRYADFPAPIAELRQGLLWSWPEVERWSRLRHADRT